MYDVFGKGIEHMGTPTSLATPSKKKIPLLLKIYAAALIVLSMISIPVAVILGFNLPSMTSELGTPIDTTTLVIAIVQIVLTAIGAVVSIFLGVRLLRDRRRGARVTAETLVVINIAVMACEVMLSGLHGPGLYEIVHLVFLIALLSYVDPSLSEERRLQRKLADLEVRERAEDGTLGRDETGKGYLELNFFNLFWIFVVCSVLGLIIEVIYHVLVVEPGVYQDRAGLLYGPFSPIYGVGGLLMTIALNRFHKAPLPVVFLVSAVIGGAFEYLASWFFQFAFGIMAWDYTGTFLSIDGRTNGMFMAMWGVLGCMWIKLLLPRMLKLVNAIPWKWRYGLTSVCAALMVVNIVMTLLAFDCWYQREAGLQPVNAMEEFFEDHYDNEFMANRFQSMTIDPSRATRVSPVELGQ